MGLYTATDWLGIVPLVVCMVFGAMGFVQMIKRKSLLKADHDITLLGIYYNTEKSKSVTFDMFTASVRKYTRARKLTPRMLNELIEKIEVHQSEKIDGKTVQQLTIHYNCIGNIEIPDLEKLPENNVSVHTRQGVDVHYAYVAS